MTDLKLTLLCCQHSGAYRCEPHLNHPCLCPLSKMIYTQLAPDVSRSQHLMAPLQSGV